MKLRLHVLAWCIFCLATSITPCPTCIGRMEESHPPLFTQEYEATYRHAADIIEHEQNVQEEEQYNEPAANHS